MPHRLFSSSLPPPPQSEVQSSPPPLSAFREKTTAISCESSDWWDELLKKIMAAHGESRKEALSSVDLFLETADTELKEAMTMGRTKAERVESLPPPESDKSTKLDDPNANLKTNSVTVSDTGETEKEVVDAVSEVEERSLKALRAARLAAPLKSLRSIVGRARDLLREQSVVQEEKQMSEKLIEVPIPSTSKEVLGGSLVLAALICSLAVASGNPIWFSAVPLSPVPPLMWSFYTRSKFKKRKREALGRMGFLEYDILRLGAMIDKEVAVLFLETEKESRKTRTEASLRDSALEDAAREAEKVVQETTWKFRY
uniref:Uncharacterized protein n=1 Tax=Chromera velia CCMP2878 TaxID=1169474 RepID=A0A0G4HU51_9ALVE|eukprot:Cvel_31703.t1-p1 / transcript=Cvel_31703.t1 / gene=Cvel_31703 / organism=Chromera_velia_CCMP2878 / gene_product=hypothetical protein / transcript_product=hypothetical protein / location=Cvel_scaffold4776:1850-2788(+) / protein_length=313 / sequence_SO=supercontig / SO=protein_coding / is_pseudo=false